jgi:hypothetical protein
MTEKAAVIERWAPGCIFPKLPAADQENPSPSLEQKCPLHLEQKRLLRLE